MALIKNKKAAIGIDGDYWRIIAIETQYGGPNHLWETPITFVTLGLYASKRIRNEGGGPLETRRIQLDGQTNGMPPIDPSFHKNPDPLLEPTRKNAYAAIRTMRDFLDAVDDDVPPV